jgi:plastocyanin
MDRVRSGKAGRLLRAFVTLGLVTGLMLSTGGIAISATKVVKAVDGNRFQPRHKYIFRNDTIRWRNTDNVAHTVKATDKLKNWNFFTNLSPGESATRKFGQLGNYYYKCTLHPGMDALIHVRAG